MATDIWFPFYVGDYLADTMLLDHRQHGIYLFLILAYYKNKGPLPDSDAVLANVTRLSLTDWKEVRQVMSRFFTVEKGLWKHKRADEEISKVVQRQESGRRGGVAKQNASETGSKHPSKSLANTLAKGVAKGVAKGWKSQSQSQSEPEAHPHPEARVSAFAEVESNPWDGDSPPAFQRLKTSLSDLYHRKPSAAWSNLEEGLLAGVSRRPDAESEFQSLKAFRASIGAKDMRFFPQSICALLEKWEAVLDRAAVGRLDSQPERKSIVESEIDRLLREVDRTIPK